MASYVPNTTTPSTSSGIYSIDDVCELMETIGLSHKVDTIKQHNVTGPRLTTMTDDDLKAIGFTGLQIRKLRLEVPYPESTETATSEFSRSSPAAAGGVSSTVASNAETEALKREIDTLKSQVAVLTASLNSLKMTSSHSEPPPPKTPLPASNAPSHSMHIPGFCRDAWIEGNQAQILTVVLGPGDVIHADKGSMVHMSSYIQMNATTGGQGLGRFVTGQSIFLTEYTYHGPPGTADKVAFSPDFAGQIIPIDLSRFGGHIICQKAGLLANSPSIDVSVEFSQSLGTGFFGGEGFILQGLRGTGHVFLAARGTIITMVLRPGEERIVSTGCLVGMEASVRYDIVTTGGLKNMLLSGEGVFNSRLTGPGTVWLESQDLNRLVQVLTKHN